ncbi:MAG: DUF4345 family protein [Anaerolineae bacterium]|nr:DUF4345 family protein [Anaerolineae bacterium]
MSGISSIAFRLVLIVLGLLNIFIGINVGFGGISTLGLQGQTEFFEVTNEAVYLVRDSHIRYFGGLYLGLGLFLILASTNLYKYQTALKLVFVLVFIGGLARFTMMRPDVIFGQDIIGSLLTELLLMPILFIWLSKIVKSSASK